MINKEFKYRLAYEVLIFLGLMALLLFITRIWALLLLVILGILIAALRLLFKRSEKVEASAALIVYAEPKPETEKDILRRAFGVIQRRITEDVESLHPTARWQWYTPGAIGRIERDEPVAVILSGAGGYHRAIVRIHNLAYKGLLFETAQDASVQLALPTGGMTPITEILPEEPDDSEDTEDIETDDQEESVNYAYLAFEWVDAKLLDLNERANEAIGRGQKTLLIPETELPHQDGWPDICKQLIASDFADAVPHADGILISLQQ